MTRRVLVIDDEADICASLSSLLQLLPGVAVTTAAGFAEGLAKARGGPWDLILSDERLPDGSGSAILEAASTASPQTRLVLMSAFQDLDALLRGPQAVPFHHFIRKPFDPVEVKAQVARMLAQPAGKVGNLLNRPFGRIGAGRPPAAAGFKRL